MVYVGDERVGEEPGKSAGTLALERSEGDMRTACDHKRGQILDSPHQQLYSDSRSVSLLRLQTSALRGLSRSAAQNVLSSSSSDKKCKVSNCIPDSCCVSDSDTCPLLSAVDRPLLSPALESRTGGKCLSPPF